MFCVFASCVILSCLHNFQTILSVPSYSAIFHFLSPSFTVSRCVVVTNYLQRTKIWFFSLFFLFAVTPPCSSSSGSQASKKCLILFCCIVKVCCKFVHFPAFVSSKIEDCVLANGKCFLLNVQFDSLLDEITLSSPAFLQSCLLSLLFLFHYFLPILHRSYSRPPFFFLVAWEIRCRNLKQRFCFPLPRLKRKKNNNIQQQQQAHEWCWP